VVENIFVGEVTDEILVLTRFSHGVIITDLTRCWLSHEFNASMRHGMIDTGE
jgi:hypothetical protein